MYVNPGTIGESRAFAGSALYATGRPESRSRNVSKETSRGEQVADVKGPFRSLPLFARTDAHAT